jgi:hypothetical protein
MPKKKFLRISFLCLAMTLFGGGCAIGPLAYNETARTIGAGGNEASFGYGATGYALKYGHGFSDSFDLGAQLEAFNWSARAKYALTGGAKGEGLSTAIGGNLGVGFFGSTAGLDLVASYLPPGGGEQGRGSWEPYGAVRYTHVSNSAVDVNNAKQSSETGSNQTLFTVLIPDYDYAQAFIGSRYWAGERWFIGVEASTLVAFNSSLTFGSGALVGASIGGQF